MKSVCSLLCLFFVMFACRGLFADVTDEKYKELENRLKTVEKVIGKIDDYYIKVDNIESDFAKINSGLSSGKASSDGSQYGNVANGNNMDKRIDHLEDMVYELKDRANLMDITEEIRRVQEYVCPDGHLYSEMTADKRCHVDSLKLKSRNRYKLFKFARRESISERIGATIEEAFDKRVVVGASGTGIIQQILSSDQKEKGFAEGSFDLLFISSPLLYTTFFIDIEAIGGNGPDDIIGSFSGLNDDSGSLQDDDGVDRLSVREVWLQSFLLDERLRLVGGKIDLTNYFDSNTVANDETTQFITSAFVNNPTMEVPENGPGIVAFFDTRKGLTFGLGLQSDDDSGFGITDDIYAIAEVGYRSHWFFNQEGNYRLWGRINGGRDDNKGFGLSIDQNLSTRLTAFARFGANEVNGGLSDVDYTGVVGFLRSRFPSGGFADNLATRLQDLTDRDLGPNDADFASAWSVGLRLRSPFFSRVNDEIAVAFGSVDAVGGDDESAAEIYYKYQINDHFAVTPNFQAIFDPAGVGGDDMVAVAGIRTQIEF